MKELLSGFKKGYALDAKLFLRFLIETKRSDAYEIEDVTSGDLQNVTTDDINAFTQYLRFSNLRGGGISNNSIVRRLNGLESFFNYNFDERVLLV